MKRKIIRAKLNTKPHANRLKARRIRRQINFHRRKYIEEMLTLFRDSDEEGRRKLEAIFLRTGGLSLAEIYEKRVIESLLRASTPLNDQQSP